jgi:hypothetical protein
MKCEKIGDKVWWYLVIHLNFGEIKLKFI